MPETYDEVHRPSHYCHGGIEAKDVVEAVLADADIDGPTAFWAGNMMKYGLRWPFKGQTPTERVRDLRKAIECAERTIECYERDQAARRRRAAETLGRAE